MHVIYVQRSLSVCYYCICKHSRGRLDKSAGATQVLYDGQRLRPALKPPASYVPCPPSPLSSRWKPPPSAAATAIDICPANVSQSAADGSRKRYWRVAQSKKSTVASSACTPTRWIERKAMDVVFPQGS